MWGFFRSHAGLATIGMCLVCLLLSWPPAISWLMATLLLAFSIHHLFEAFRELDASETAETDVEAEVEAEAEAEAGAGA